MLLPRKLTLDLPQGQSAFLWGARQTGKSTFLRTNYDQSIVYDLLMSHELTRLTKNPALLREEVLELTEKQLKHPIIIDEVQKIPELLNEVHWLIENSNAKFILCGSSARKLKTQSTNLLGGRAWVFNFFPLFSSEIENFDLLRALQHGLIPNHYLAEPNYINEYFQAYVDVYLTDEIRNEGLVRNLAAFAKFLDVAGLTNGEMINAVNIARDCGADRSTVQGYYQILIDTMLGYFVYPYNKKIKRDLVVATPKFYLFDLGIANYLGQRSVTGLRGAAAGNSFEHFILMQLTGYIATKRLRSKLHYWRTKSGLEVDFILGDAEIAIEVKISEQVHKKDLKGLIAFCTEHPNAKPFVVSQDVRARRLDIDENISIHILPWKTFLKKLWQGEILYS